MIKLVASDLDGTIIDKNNHIDDNNFNAINYIKSHKLPFIICTGKTYPLTKDVCSLIQADYGIFGNGNQILDLETGKEIYKNLLSKEQILKCISVAKSNNLHVHVYTDKEVITEELLYLDLRNYKLQKCKKIEPYMDFILAENIEDYISSKDINIYKLVITSDISTKVVTDKILNSLNVSITTIRKFGKYKDLILNKEYEYIDIMPKNVNKNTAIQFLGDYLKIKPSEMLTIGDNLNDYDMVKDAGIGVAVANAYDELKQVAKFTTTNPVQKGGFAEAIYKFI